MISNDLESLAAALGDMAGRVNEEAWMQLRCIRDNLIAKAFQRGAYTATKAGARTGANNLKAERKRRIATLAW